MRPLLLFIALESQQSASRGRVFAFYRIAPCLRTFARNFSNIDIFQKILPLKDHELAMSEM